MPSDLHDLRQRMGAGLFAGALLLSSYVLYTGARKVFVEGVLR